MPVRIPKSKTTLLGVLITIVVFANFAVYFNALSNGFVYDDDAQIVENYWIRDFRYIPKIFLTDVWKFYGEPSNYYRPLMHVIYTVNYHIFGLRPWGFHLVNIFFHAGVSVLVFLIASALRLGAGPSNPAVYSSSGENQGGVYGQPARPEETLSAPFLAALIFGLHPIHTEAVAWAAGLPEISLAFFYLFSLYMYVRSREGERLRMGMYLLSVAAFFLSMLCKEPGVTLPVVLIAYEYVFKRPLRLSDSLKRYFPYFMAAGIYFLLRFNALGGFVPVKSDYKLGMQQFIMNVFPLFAQYVRMVFFPVNLSAWHVFHPVGSLLSSRGLVSICVVLLFSSGVFFSMKRDKPAFFFLVLGLLPLLPSFYIQGIFGKPIAERYLYLPSVAFAVLAPLCIGKAVTAPKSRMAVTTVFALMLCLFSFGTISRNAVWKDNYSLWSDTVRKAPDAAVPRTFLADDLFQKNRMDEAIQQYRAALALEPDSATAHNNLGLAYSKQARTDEAIGEYEAALRIEPESAETRNGLGIAYKNKGWVDKAIEQYLIAIRYKPDHAELYYNLATAYEIKGLKEMAEQSRAMGRSLERRLQ
jgi:tetratricopeptide (TPR) repeat protein